MPGYAKQGLDPLGVCNIACQDCGNAEYQHGGDHYCRRFGPVNFVGYRCRRRQAFRLGILYLLGAAAAKLAGKVKIIIRKV